MQAQAFEPTWEQLQHIRSQGPEVTQKAVMTLSNALGQNDGESLNRADLYIAGPKQDDIEKLKYHRGNPAARKAFDGMYGTGAAAYLLKEDPTVLQTAIDVTYGAVRGPIAAVDELGQSLGELIEWTNETVYGSSPSVDLDPDLTENMPKPDTMGGNIAGGITQFLTGWIAGAPIKVASKVPVIAKFVPLLRGAFSDAAAFDPEDPLFIELLNDMGVESTQPVIDYIRDPANSDAETRAYRAIEGAGLGIFLSMVWGGVKYLGRAIKNPDAADQELTDYAAQLRREMEDLQEQGAQVEDGKIVLREPSDEVVDGGNLNTTPLPVRPVEGETLQSGTITNQVEPLPNIENPNVASIVERKADEALNRENPFTPIEGRREGKYIVGAREGDPDLAKARDDANLDEATMWDSRGRSWGMPDEAFTSALLKDFDETFGQFGDDFLNTANKKAEYIGKAKEFASDILDGIRNKNTVEGLIKAVRKSTLEDGPALHVAVKAVIRTLNKDRKSTAMLISQLRESGDTAALKIQEVRYDQNLASWILASKLDKEIGSVWGATGKARQTTPFTMTHKVKEAFDAVLGKNVDETVETVVTTKGKKGGKKGKKVREVKKAEKVEVFELLQDLRKHGIRVEDAEAFVEDMLRSGAVNRGRNVFGAMPDKPSAINKLLLGINEYRTSSGLLSGPKTLEINFLTGLANTIISPMMEGLGRGSIQPLRQYAGMAKGYRKAVRGFIDSLRTGEQVLTGTGSRLENNATTMIPRALGGDVWRLAGRLLLATDTGLKHLNYHGVVYANAVELGQKSGLKGDKLRAFVTDHLRKSYDETGFGVNPAAREAADHRLFTKDFSTKSKYAGERMLAIPQDFLNRHVLGRILGTPFYRTPIRLIEQGIRLIPGLNYATMRRYRDDMAGVNGKMAQYRSRGEMMVGAAYVASAWSLAEAGHLTGSISNDPKIREMNKKRGIKPEMIKVAGEWRSYSQMEPFATTLRFVANAVAAKNHLMAQGHQRYVSEEEQIKEMVSGGLVGIIHSLRSSPMMEPVDKWFKFFDALEKGNAGEQWKKLAAREVATYVPNLARKFSKKDDAVARESYGPKVDGFELFGQTFKSEMVKGLGAGLTGLTTDPVRDYLGKELPRNVTNDWVLVQAEHINKNKVLQNIHQAQLMSGVNLTFPKSRVNGVDLTKMTTKDGKQSLYDRWQQLTGEVKDQLSGKNLETALEEAIAQRNTLNEGWGADGNPGAGTIRLQAVLKTYREVAFAKLLIDEPSLMLSQFQPAISIARMLIAEPSEFGKNKLSQFFEDVQTP